MHTNPTQPEFVSNFCRTISGQLAEWGIAFSQDRVAQLTSDQHDELQTWINAGVDADEDNREAFASLPEFMENELLEMNGTLVGDSQETIIEQAINAYEAETSITENPYLFDTDAWHLWRTAYCRWHRGESLDFPENPAARVLESEDQNTISDIHQRLIQLTPQLNQTEHSLKQLRRQIKQIKHQRNTFRKQQTLLLHQLCESFDCVSKTNSTDKIKTTPESKEHVSQNHETKNTQQPLAASSTAAHSSIVRIPVTEPETNRVEVFLQQDSQGQWRAGHLWSVEADTRTGQLSRGSRQPDLQQTAYPTETEALIHEVINLSQSLIGVPDIEHQIIDYLNLLEEYPGQIAVCGTCESHYINDDQSESDFCPECLGKSD